jgi:hypothetical protein
MLLICTYTPFLPPRKYKDLQKLAATLGQKGNGKRDDIVERLQKWHLKDPDFDSDASDKSDGKLVALNRLSSLIHYIECRLFCIIDPI